MEDNRIVKQELKKVLFTVVTILVIFGILYYLESSFGLLRKMLA